MGGRIVRSEDASPPDRESDAAADGTCKTAVRSRRSRMMDRAGKRLVGAIPEIAERLVAEARLGSIPHMKLLLQLVGLEDGGLAPRDKSRREKTLEEIVMEQWRKEP